jgi:hypothetical protein
MGNWTLIQSKDYLDNMNKGFFALVVLLLLTGCRQQISVGGVILDEETKKPVVNVYVSQKKLFENTVLEDLDSSDNNGYYKFNHPLRGKLIDNVFVTLYFFKNGLTLSRNIRNGVLDDTVLLPAFYRNGKIVNKRLSPNK